MRPPIVKYKNGDKVKDRSKYAILTTYYPFISRYPYTGHSSLQVVEPDGIGSLLISKGGRDKDYNLITNNCSDATRCGLEKAFNKQVNPLLFTTPGDVQDFAISELKGIPEIKGDSIYDPSEHRYKLDTRSETLKRRYRGESKVYIPLSEEQRDILEQYAKETILKKLKTYKNK